MRGIAGAGGDVEVIEQAGRREDAHDAFALVGVDAGAGRVHLVEAYAGAEREAAPAARADRGRDLDQEAAAVLGAAAVLVGTVVVQRRQELHDQVAVRRVDLDTVAAALLHVGRGGDVAVDQRLDLLRVDRVGLLAEDHRGDVRRPPECPHVPQVLVADILAPPVAHLHEHLGAVRVDGVGEQAVALAGTLAPALGAAWDVPERGSMHGLRAGDDQRRTALGTVLPVADGLVAEQQVGAAIVLLVRRLDDAVGQDGRGANRDWLP